MNAPKHMVTDARLPQATSPLTPAAAYVRVSTKRQAENELSLAEQKAAIAAYAAEHGLTIVTEYVEAGASGTTDRRPELQRMIRDAARRPVPFKAVVVFNHSRFFRNAEESAAYRLKLSKCGVQLLSATQDFGSGAHAELITHILSAIDGHASRINAEQVKLMMVSNANQGWWNGARPPLGYRVVADRQLGKKMKKRLSIDHNEAELVRRIFNLYLVGENGSGPLGLKAICTLLNTEGVRLRGKPFMTSTVSDILRRSTYVGDHIYNQRDSRAGTARPPEEWVHVPCPAIIEQSVFDSVQRRLQAHQPAVTPPRRANSPTLLAQVGRCGEPGCGSSLLLMTGKGGRYRYLTCQTKRTQSRGACSLGNFPTEQIDSAVITALEEQILVPDRLADLLAQLLDRTDAALAERRARIGRLRARRTEAMAATARIWDAIEGGLAKPTDPDVRSRLEQRRLEVAALDEEIRTLDAETPGKRTRQITHEVIERFADMMRKALRGPDPHLRRGYLHMLVSEVRLSNTGLIIRGTRPDLEMAVARCAQATASTAPDTNVPEMVPTFARKWRTREDSNLWPLPSEGNALSS